jgi:methylmalonyl-CoA/ethylmalonyl-CoA epimerase
MIKKVEHIGIAVNKLEASKEVFEKLLNASMYKTEEVETEAVKTGFFLVGDTKIELLEATSNESPIAKFIEKRKEGIHHIALDVDDIYAEIERLKNKGFIILNETPKKGADNKLVCFLHPKSTNGILVELCQDIKE